ncbi:ester cyclase [Streptomyces sp. NPDC001307]|uniref:ester cyclase n=1 Tax=Streptomyces sp. NPDC001307 TaxID=3364560 RepID=UPI0036913606
MLLALNIFHALFLYRCSAGKQGLESAGKRTDRMNRGITMERRSMLKGGATAFGALAITAVASGSGLAEATQAYPGLLSDQATTPVPNSGGPRGAVAHDPLPDPATTPVPNPPFPCDLTRAERQHLETFDELDFVVISHAEWDRLGESHAKNVRVHWPDGHYTDGLDRHVEDLKALFVWAPDLSIESHPLRVAKNELTAVTGVFHGTFSRPMPDGKGGFIQPTGKKFSINLCTVGIWNRKGAMDEEFLFYDNLTFYRQIGLA